MWRPPGPIPAAVRLFRRFPNAADWRPGDLVLFNSIQPGFISRRIIQAQQRGGYAAEDACWHHAAVYLGEHLICEATGAGVRVTPIYGYIGSHKLRVRRSPQLGETDGWRIAMHATFKLGASYSYGTIARLLVQSMRGFWRRPEGAWTGPRKAQICSKLYADAYTIATGRTLGNAVDATTIPAYLSFTTDLVDQVVYWCGID